MPEIYVTKLNIFHFHLTMFSNKVFLISFTFTFNLLRFCSSVFTKLNSEERTFVDDNLFHYFHFSIIFHKFIGCIQNIYISTVRDSEKRQKGI